VRAWGALYTAVVSRFGRLLGYARRYRRQFLTGLACSIATSTIALTSPLVLRYAVDDLARQVTRGKLVQYAENLARAKGLATLFCLSTQAANYFVQKGGYRVGTPDDLPPARREKYDLNGRKSKVLVKSLV